jgi:hypothetical protein
MWKVFHRLFFQGSRSALPKIPEAMTLRAGRKPGGKAEALTPRGRVFAIAFETGGTACPTSGRKC